MSDESEMKAGRIAREIEKWIADHPHAEAELRHYAIRCILEFWIERTVVWNTREDTLADIEERYAADAAKREAASGAAKTEREICDAIVTDAISADLAKTLADLTFTGRYYILANTRRVAGAAWDVLREREVARRARNHYPFLIRLCTGDFAMDRRVEDARWFSTQKAGVLVATYDAMQIPVRFGPLEPERIILLERPSDDAAAIQAVSRAIDAGSDFTMNMRRVFARAGFTNGLLAFTADDADLRSRGDGDER